MLKIWAKEVQEISRKAREQKSISKMAIGASLSTHLHSESAACSTLALCQPQCPQPQQTGSECCLQTNEHEAHRLGSRRVLAYGTGTWSKQIQSNNQSPVENTTASYVVWGNATMRTENPHEERHRRSWQLQQQSACVRRGRTIVPKHLAQLPGYPVSSSPTVD